MKKILTIAAAVSLVSGACSKRFLNLNPVTQVGVDNFYKTSSDILNAVNGAYGALQSTGLYSESYYFIADYPSDNVENQLIAAQYDFDQFDRFYVNSANTYLNPFWTDSYKGIARCNSIIAQAPDVQMADSLRNRYVGEAKYVRALLYFNLVRVFGDVPLVTEPNSLPSSPVLTLMTQISLDNALATSVMWLNSCASRSARFCLSDSRWRLFACDTGMARRCGKR